MKKLMMALVVLSTLSVGYVLPARANDKCEMCKMKMDAGKKLDKLAIVLDLNDKQKGAVKDLLDAKVKKMDAAADQFMKVHDQAADEFEAGLKKVLSANQAKKFDTWKDLNKHECGH